MTLYNPKDATDTTRPMDDDTGDNLPGEIRVLKTYLETELPLKADAADVYAKTGTYSQDEVETEISTAVAEIEQELSANYSTTNETDTKTFESIVSALMSVFPVGTIYENAAVATNPGTLLGFGTWVAFGTGKVTVALDANDPDFNVIQEIGGSKTVTLTGRNIGATPALGVAPEPTNYPTNIFMTKKFNEYAHDPSKIGNMDAPIGQAAATMPPYITVYRWIRIA